MHNDPQKSSFKSSSRHIVFAPPFSRKLPKETETPRNSLSMRILHGTSLLSGFYSATMPVNSRKKGVCLQNLGGGAPMAQVCQPIKTNGQWDSTNPRRMGVNGSRTRSGSEHDDPSRPR